MKVKEFETLLKQRVLVFDGATGTNLQLRNPTVDDYAGKEGCTEILLETHPDWIEELHASFFKVGCQVVETDSFGANRIVLAEYGIAERAYELNVKAAKLARRVADQFATKAEPRFVAGSIGPGTKLPSLGHIDFDTLCASYVEQASGLIAGGADLLLIETCQDILQTKAAIVACLEAMRQARTELPLMVQVTVETTGTMLLGTEMAAAITALAPYPIVSLGINCATGPQEMSEHVRTLSQTWPRFISVLPNAGLPENVGGKAVYKLTPDQLGAHLKDFVTRYGVNIVGGCCGTSPDHLAKVVEAVRGLAPIARRPTWVPAASSLYIQVPFQQEPKPLIIGERTNANGSKQFRELLAQNDYDAIAEMGKNEANEGAHILDICTAYVGRQEMQDMAECVKRMALQVRVPLMIDSTEAPVIEEALKRAGGRCLINSINLEDGEERMAKICPLAKKYGAGVVALTIDEKGMAKTRDQKVAIAKRIHQLATEKYGLRSEDLFFDALTFTLGSGDEEFRKAGLETLEAIRQIKKELPGVNTVLGVSNISFGLSPQARQSLNSVFLHFAIEAGLDAAIVHARKILPLFKIDDQGRELARQLVFDERKDGFDPLKAFMAHYEGAKLVEAVTEEQGPQTIEEKLKKRIVDGNKQGLEELLKEALGKYGPLDIINRILLDGMRVVGELFGSGQMQLPFVLQSAETMKAAVRYLEPFMPKADQGQHKGKMVLATVKGDVHDIGKNLVDIILTNNGYKVINLGIKMPIDDILKAADSENADAIGMSGLLVKSTAVMRENLEEMNRRGVKTPVILGGAALTRSFVEKDLRELYNGYVFYGRDAFEGLRVMEELTDPAAAKKAALYVTRGGSGQTTRPGESRQETGGQTFAPVPPAAVPRPPFWGSRVARGIALPEVFKYLNETALLKVRWGFTRGKTEDQAYKKLLNETVQPLFAKWKEYCIKEQLLVPQVVYGYFPCLAEGDDLVIYRPEDLKTEWLRFAFPRQKSAPGRSISDFFLPRQKANGLERDVLGAFIVTVGTKASEETHTLFKKNSYADYLYLHGLSVETAEALAELWHRRMREELAITGEDAAEVREWFHQKYRGSRYSFGYPACPRLEDQSKLFELLDPSRIKVSLSEEYQLNPEQSTSAIVVHHPHAKYFSVE